MAAALPSIAEAFRRLQSGDAVGALELARRVAAADPSNARAHLAIGIAHRMAGRHAEAAAALGRAREIDPRDHAAAYESGVVHQLQGRVDAAIECFERSAALRPDFFAAPFSAGLLHAERGSWEAAAECFRRVLRLQPGQPEAMLQLALALAHAARHEQAEAAFVQALATHPGHPGVIRAFAQYSASRGNFTRAASLFAEATRLEPAAPEAAMFLAQCELLLGRWPSGWLAYSRRPMRLRFEQERAAKGAPYVLPPLDAMAGKTVTLVAEQGLGDIVFFLRWAPLLRQARARLAFAGEPRLHGPLERTGLFESLQEDAAQASHPLLVADLPALFPAIDPLTVAPLALAPLPDRLARWKRRLRTLGPRPWIGAQWRAGTPRDLAATALSKEVPVEPLFAALARFEGTLVSVQRGPRAGELEQASRAAGRTVHDLAGANEDPEDVLALVSLLDRHVAVSSTTLHLAASAGAAAQVLVPFPPEWRWRPEGDSPWFPNMRVYRQGVDGDWAAALAAVAGGDQGNGLQ